MQKEELMESITKGNFSLRILYEQLANIQKMGPVGQVRISPFLPTFKITSTYINQNFNITQHQINMTHHHINLTHHHHTSPHRQYIDCLKNMEVEVGNSGLCIVEDAYILN